MSSIPISKEFDIEHLKVDKQTGMFAPVLEQRKKINVLRKLIEEWKIAKAAEPTVMAEQRAILASTQENLSYMTAEHTQKWGSWGSWRNHEGLRGIGLISFLWTEKFPSMFAATESSLAGSGNMAEDSTRNKAAPSVMGLPIDGRGIGDTWTRDDWNSALASSEQMSSFIKTEIATLKQSDVVERIKEYIKKLEVHYKEGREDQDRHIESLPKEELELNNLEVQWKRKWNAWKKEQEKKSDDVKVKPEDRKASVDDASDTDDSAQSPSANLSNIKTETVQSEVS